MSVDGYVAGPNQSVKDPLGVGGDRLSDNVGGPDQGLEQVRVVEAPGMAHLRYRVVKSSA